MSMKQQSEIMLQFVWGFDHPNIATSLVTLHYDPVTMRCWFNVGPASVTLAHHWTGIRTITWLARAADVLTHSTDLPSKYKTFVYDLYNDGPTWSNIV